MSTSSLAATPPPAVTLRRLRGALGVQVEQDHAAALGGEREGILAAEAGAPPVTSATFPLIPRSMRRPEVIRARRKRTLNSVCVRWSRYGSLLAAGSFLAAASGRTPGCPRRRPRYRITFWKARALDLEGLVDRRLDAVVDRLDDEPRGDGRARRELAREGLGVVERRALLGQAVDEPDPVALRGGDLRAEEQMLQREAAPDQARGRRWGAAVALDARRGSTPLAPSAPSPSGCGCDTPSRSRCRRRGRDR